MPIIDRTGLGAISGLSNLFHQKALGFEDKHRITLEQGRVFVTDFIENYFHVLQKEPILGEYTDYRKERFKKSQDMFLPDAVVLEQVGLKIGYWNENYDRPKHPYLAQILFQEKTFFYYEANPETQALQLVFQEGYEDVLRFRESQKPKA